MRKQRLVPNIAHPEIPTFDAAAEMAAIAAANQAEDAEARRLGEIARNTKQSSIAPFLIGSAKGDPVFHEIFRQLDTLNARIAELESNQSH